MGKKGTPCEIRTLCSSLEETKGALILHNVVILQYIIDEGS
jgi:hypothetical protein